MPAASYEVLASSTAESTARPADETATDWPRLGVLELRPIARRDLERDPAFADVVPMRRRWADGVALVGIAAPAAVWPGQAFTVEGFWTHAGPSPALPSAVRLVGPWAEGARSDPAARAALPDTPWPGGEGSVYVTRWTGRSPSDAAPDAGATLPPPRLQRVRVRGDSPDSAFGPAVRIPALAARTRTPGLAGAVPFDDGIALVGFEPRRRIVAPGDWIAVRTDWSAARRPEGRDKAFVQLLDASQALRASSDREVLYGAEPTDEWRPGELHRDVYFVRVPDVMAPGAAWLQVGLYDKTTRLRRRVLAPDGAPGDDRFLTGVYVADGMRPGAPVPADRTAALAFDGGPTITALGLPPRGAIRAGTPLTVTVRWRVEAPIERDWTVFVHLLAGDPGAVPIAQADGMPFGDIFPMRLWPRGADLTSVHRLTVPAGASATDDWAVAVGLYDGASLERAAVHGRVEGGSVDEGNRRAIVRPPPAAR